MPKPLESLSLRTPVSRKVGRAVAMMTIMAILIPRIKHRRSGWRWKTLLVTLLTLQRRLSFVAQSGCGNDTIENAEECDGAALDGESCTALGFSGGTLACRPRCASDDSDCTLPCFFELKDCLGGPSMYVTNVTSNTVSVINTATDEVAATVKVLGRNRVGLRSARTVPLRT